MALHLADEVVSTGPGGGSPPLSLISQNLLETASYERSGTELVLVSETGERLTVADYFASSNPPNLVADNGAFISGATVSLLAGGSTVQVAQAGAEATGGALRIGLVETLAGTATAQRLDGSVTNLKTGDPVFQGDVVKVSGDGKLGLSFLDKSVFSLSGGGTMTLNEMIYNPDSTSTNKMVFGLVNGSLSFVTGAVAPTGGVTIETPVAVMAIRGTIPIALDAGGGKYLILSDQGQFQVIPKLPGSDVLTIDDSGKAIYFPFGLSGAPQVIDLAGSGLEDDVALLIAQLNESRQDFLERRADATGSPEFAEYETFEWIEGEAILTELSDLLAPLLQATELAQIEPSANEDVPSPADDGDPAVNIPSVISGESTAALIETDEAQSISGTLSVSDADDPDAAFVPQADVTGSNGYGSFTIDTEGHWTYVMASAQDGFAEGEDYIDQITVTTTDGTTQVITVTITGTDDGAIIGGAIEAALTETDAAQSISGALSVTDADDPDTAFLPQADVAGSNGYGSFTIDAEGQWTYVMASAQDGFVAGQDYIDQITVTATDGTTQVITVTITGSNDAPVAIAASNAVTEDTVVTGSVSGSDADEGETASLTYALVGAAPAGLTFNSDGSYSFDAASYDSLSEGEELELSIPFTATDAQGAVSGPATLLITVTGTNDRALISGVTTGSITEDVAVTDGALATSGIITISDADEGEAIFVAQVSTDGTYGTFALDADGSWTYKASNGLEAIQQLGEGDTLTETFTAVSVDGTTQDITITINGTNDVAVIGGVTTGSVTEDVNVSAGDLTVSGGLSITDADAGEAVFVPQASTAGSYGIFTLAIDGSWIYSASNDQAAIQQLGEGDTLTETFIVASADGTTQEITVTINGSNDGAVIGGVTTGSVTEDVNVSAGKLITSGTLAISDADNGEAVFMAQANTAGTYGAFTLEPDGSWTYKADNALAAIQQLGAGETLTETFTATSADGTTQEITVTINGSNDSAVIGGATTGSVTEDVDLSGGSDDESEAYGLNIATSGQLTVTDADSGESLFVAQPWTEGSYGNFVLDSDGSWTYSASNDQQAIQQLGAGDTLSETFTVASADGTTQEITVTINGTNDGAVIGGTTTGSVTEDSDVASGNLAASGQLTVSDIDSGQSVFQPQTDTAGTYGTFSIAADGSWTYIASNDQQAIQQLGAGDTLSETFTVASADGTTQEITVTINGTNDGAVIGGTTTGSVTEDTDLYASGNLTIWDADEGEAEFREQTSFAGSYGTFTLDADGSWTYSLNNTHPDVQALDDGQTLTDSFTAVSADESSSQVVKVIINGVSDVPVPPPPYTGTDDPNDFDSIGNVAIYEPEVAYESGGSGRQTWNGTDNHDEINAGESDDTVYGHGGDDVINGNGGNDTGNGGGNGNGLYGQSGNDTITGGAGKDQIYGGSGDDVIYGGTNPYTTSGPSDQDVLYGGSGADTLYGQDGDDDLIGGYGADTLYGGNGKDTFIYLSVKDTGDTIEDFVVGQDKIDLTELLGAGNLQSAGNTTTVSANSFNWYQDGANTIVTADVTGDSVADFAITLKGVNASDVQENSFAY